MLKRITIENLPDPGDTVFTNFPSCGEMRPTKVISCRCPAVSQSKAMVAIELDGQQKELDIWWLYKEEA